MARRDASRKLGGMAGVAAGALRGRQATLDAALGEGPAKRVLKNAVKGKPAPKKKSRY